MDRCFLLLKHRSKSGRIESHVLGITNSEIIHLKLKDLRHRQKLFGENFRTRLLCSVPFFYVHTFYIHAYACAYRCGIFILFLHILLVDPHEMRIMCFPDFLSGLNCAQEKEEIFQKVNEIIFHSIFFMHIICFYILTH